MRYARYLGLDVREGWRCLARWYGAAVGLFLLVIGALRLMAGAPFAELSLGDYLVAYTSGMKEQVYTASEPFRFPAMWAAVFLFAAYLTLWFPHRDLAGMGSHVLVAGGSRWAWWLAKCTWTVLAVLLFWAVAWAVALGWTALSGGALSLSTLEKLPEVLQMRITGVPFDPAAMALFLFVGVPVATCALCLLQQAVAFAAGPLVGYAASVSVLLLSAFTVSPWLIGNAMMAARCSDLVFAGVSVADGLLACAVVAVASVVGGGVRFCHGDVLGRKELS